MSNIMFVLFFLCAVGINFAQENTFHLDYMSLDKTNAVKGVFVILVFLRHFRQYVTLNTVYDKMFISFDSYIGQLLVTLFLFYSGYGVMESIKKKGLPYIKQLPIQRALKVLIHFDIAILLFLFTNLILGNTISLRKFLLSLICIKTIGNSNWYIFVVIAVYLITFIAFILCSKHMIAGAVISTLLCGILICVLIPLRPTYWYNTILCYPLGLWFSILKDKLENIVTKNDISYYFVLFVFIISYFFSYSKSQDSVIWYELLSINFVILVILITMKISIANGFLQLLGKHTFSLYILQRLPMLCMSQGYFNLTEQPYIFFIIAFIATIAIALIYDQLVLYIADIIFHHPMKKQKEA